MAVRGAVSGAPRRNGARATVPHHYMWSAVESGTPAASPRETLAFRTVRRRSPTAIAPSPPSTTERSCRGSSSWTWRCPTPVASIAPAPSAGGVRRSPWSGWPASEQRPHLRRDLRGRVGIPARDRHRRGDPARMRERARRRRRDGQADRPPRPGHVQQDGGAAGELRPRGARAVAVSGAGRRDPAPTAARHTRAVPTAPACAAAK